jgi:hypothetical protein
MYGENHCGRCRTGISKTEEKLSEQNKPGAPKNCRPFAVETMVHAGSQHKPSATS